METRSKKRTCCRPRLQAAAEGLRVVRLCSFGDTGLPSRRKTQISFPPIRRDIRGSIVRSYAVAQGGGKGN